MDIIKHSRNINHGSLFLHGVFKRDVRKLEDMLKDQLLNEDYYASDITEIKSYDALPVHYTSDELWPKSCNFQCWWCTLNFKGIPRSMPLSIEPISSGQIGNVITAEELKNMSNKKGILIPTKGVFCSFNCVAAYITTYIHDLFDRLNKLAMLKYIYELQTKKKAKDIHPSPPPTDMVQFGGTMGAQQYRAKIESLDESYQKEITDDPFKY